ncbi:hypothetical protein AC1031_015057 [Aphanomyces cochlioides]|nr:hypothetical protein AC1031_015057 [Aphanomyces cochlioides]
MSTIHVVDPVTRFVQDVDANEALSHRLGAYSPTEVVMVGCLLCKLNLPIPIANKILHLAGFLTGFFEETDEIVQERANVDREYLRLAIPDEMGHEALQLDECVSLTIECISRDQGWASDEPHLNNTYEGCHSWIEFTIKDENGNDVMPRQDVCRNFRANSSYRHHMIQLRDSAILSHLQPGNQIVVYIRAIYPGWANLAKYARITVAFAAGLKDSVDTNQLLKTFLPTCPPGGNFITQGVESIVAHVGGPTSCLLM